jgi:predicted O-methyltransferase YrrM
MTMFLNNNGKELKHFVRFIMGLENPKTQTTLAEQQAISKYAKDKYLAVEIGVFEGFNTLNIAKSLANSGQLYAIDPFIKGRMGICYGELISRNYIKRAELNNKVNFIKKYSFDASSDVPDYIDFIFLDGDHSYEGIKSDWIVWTEKLKQDGIIALHDTFVNSNNENVRNLGSFKYFNESISIDNRFELLETIDSMNVLRKVR